MRRVPTCVTKAQDKDGGHGACAPWPTLQKLHLITGINLATVIASASEAIQKATREDWIASSLSLLAMTANCSMHLASSVVALPDGRILPLPYFAR
jgi:hypothetical protein